MSYAVRALWSTVPRLLGTFILLSVLTQVSADEWESAPLPIQPARYRTEREGDQLSAAALFMEGRILERRNEGSLALRKYQRAWRLDPEARVILKQIVPLALELGRVDEATRYALLLANADLEDPFLAERVAMLMTDQLQYDRSLQLYQHVLQLRAKEPETRDPIGMHFEMGRLYYLTKQYKPAAQAFRIVLNAIENPEWNNLSDEVRSALLADEELTYSLIAESFLEAGEYADARVIFQKAAAAGSQQDDSGWLDFQLARVDYRAGKYAQAQKKLESYVQQKLNFGGTTPYEILQSLMESATAPERSEPDRPSAIARFRDWLSDDPDNFPLLSYVADLTRKKGTLDDAAKLYEKSLAANPTVEVYSKLLDAYLRLQDSEMLLYTLTRVMTDVRSLEPFREEISQIVANRELLESLFELGRTNVELDGGDAQTMTCGRLAVEAKRFVQADEFISQLKDEAEQLDLYVTWGLQCLEDEEYDKAVKVFCKTLATPTGQSNEGVLRYYLSGALQLAGRTDEALSEANAAASLVGDIPEVSLRPYWIHYQAGNNDLAQAGYAAWLNKYSDDYSAPGLREIVREARYVMSDICMQKKQFDEAIESLELVLDEYPDDVGASNDLGYLLVDQNRSLARATEMIRFAVEAEPDNTAYRDSLGWGLFRQGKFEEAVTELRKAASQTSVPDPIILDHLADALLASGDISGAVAVWERALSHLHEVDPEVMLVTQIRQKIEPYVVESK